MSLLTIIWSMLSAAGFIIGLVHLLVWMYDRGRLVHLAAAVMAIGAGAQALGELGLMKATTLDGLPVILMMGNFTIAIVLVSMVWFVHLLLGSGRRILLLVITGLWIAGSVINAFSPNSLTYSSLDGLDTGTTFWGETFSLIRGTTHPLKWVADLASLLIMIFVADASVQAWRAGRRQRATVVGGMVLGFILAAGIHTPLVDAGVVKTPFMISVAFLGIVLALSQQLAREAARAIVFARELGETRQELDRVMRSNLLGEFVSSMAHELNQPLAAILANAQSAGRYLDGESPRVDEAREVIDLIVRDDKRAATVLQRLRNMMTRGEVIREVFELHPALEEVLEICGSELREKDINLEVDFATGSPRVQAGRVEIQQVALNLLRNAVRALGANGAEGRKIRIGSRVVNGQVEVAVEDNGPGIAADQLETIFTPFNGEGGQGLGIGLTICRRIIESHGGTIEASRTDRGARLVFTLPESGEVAAHAAEM